jgi:hypothetical protein
MKTLTILALVWVMSANANAGLTGTQINQVIAFADKGGFSYSGTFDLKRLDNNGKTSIKRLMIFYRVTDGDYACVDPSVLTLQSALDEFVGSEYMWELGSNGILHNKTPVQSNQ